MNRRYIYFFVLLSVFLLANIVEGYTQGTDEPKLKIGGYIQTQWQYGEEDSKPSVGKYTNGNESISRFGIRRGRVKFSYDEDFGKAVIQLDATEKSIGVKDAYLELMYPPFKWISFRAGIFDRPFGYEIRYSSSLRETPERSAVFQTLFPQERDLGGMVTFQAPKNHALHSLLKLEVGLFSGNGIKTDSDNKKDFIGRVSSEKIFGNQFKLSGGFSTYLGKVKTVNDTTFHYTSNGFEIDNRYSADDYLNRQYFGVDAQAEYSYLLGTTVIRGEYLFGKQPGLINNSKSPNSDELPDISTKYYLRDFNGASVYLVHRFGQDKNPIHAVVLRYDFYNPNTKVSQNEVGKKANTSSADLATSTFTFGYILSPHKQIRIMAACEIRNNETSEHIGKYKSNLKDNLFTLRIQYKF